MGQDLQAWNLAMEAFARATSREEELRVKAIHERQLYYDGAHPASLKRQAGLPDPNIVLNYPRLIVDTGVRYLMNALEVTTDAEDEQGDAEDAAVEALWSRDGALTRQKIATSGAIGACAFVKLQPQADLGAPSLDNPPLVVDLDPSNMTVLTDPDDYTTVLEYRYAWLPADAEPTPKRQRTIRQQDETWLIVDEHLEKNVWVEDGRETWPYAWSPVFSCQNMPKPNEYWGVSDLEPDLLGLVRSANRIGSVWQKILLLHGHPTLFGKGLGERGKAGSAAWSIGQMVTGGADSDLKVVEMAGDLQAIDTYYNRVTDAIHEFSQIPVVATGKLESTGQLSGVALQILYSPLVQKTERKRETYGALVRDVTERGLELMGITATVTLNWPEVTPNDPLSERQSLQIDLTEGLVSKHTAMIALGYDPDVEEPLISGEADQAMERERQLMDAGEGPAAQPYKGQ